MKKVLCILMIMPLISLCGCGNSFDNSPVFSVLTGEQREVLSVPLSNSRNRLYAVYDDDDVKQYLVYPSDYTYSEVDNEVGIEKKSHKDPKSVHDFIGAYSRINSGSMFTLYSSQCFFGIDYLRRNEQGGLYSVHMTKEGGYVYIFYSEKTATLGEAMGAEIFYVEKRLSYKDFDKIKEGSTYSEVKKIDATTQLNENRFYTEQRRNVAGGNDITKINWSSSHYTEDGIIIFVYEFKDDAWRVSRILKNGHETRTKGSHGYKTDVHILEKDWP